MPEEVEPDGGKAEFKGEATGTWFMPEPEEKSEPEPEAKPEVADQEA